LILSYYLLITFWHTH